MIEALLIVACGLVVAGLARETWQITTRQRLEFGVVCQGGILAPVHALAVVVSLPVLLIEAGLFARDGDNSLAIELLSLAAAGGLAFIHGVVLLAGLDIIG